MTLESRNCKNRYVGNGATKQFPFNFKVWKPTQVLVVTGDGINEQEVSAQCSINISSSGGTVTFPIAPDSGTIIVIRRNMPYTQEDDYHNCSRFDAEEVEDRLDQDCAERQDLLAGLDSCIKLPETSVISGYQAMAYFQKQYDDVMSALKQSGDVTGATPITAYGTTLARSLTRRFADIVNVKDYGALGNGLSDDIVSIQTAINSNPGKTIWFPAGTYLVSEPIKTSAVETEKVFLLLDNGTTIKAKQSFVGEYLVELGRIGVGATSYGATSYFTGIHGGVFDCSNLCGGVRSQKTHLAHLECFVVINCRTIGIDLEPAEYNGSGDVYINNVDCHCSNGSDVNTIGFFVNSFDNDIRDIRCANFHIGVDLPKGGFVSNAHTITGVMDENYDTTVGFRINGAILVNCYADNFANGFQQVQNSHWWGTNLYAFWYTNTNNRHVCIDVPNSIYFRGNIHGLKYEVPVNGTNIGIDIHINPSVSSYGWSDFNNHGIYGLEIAEDQWARLSYKETDFILCNRIIKTDEVYSRNASLDGRIEIGKWYPLFVANGGDLVHDLSVKFENKLCFDLKVRFGSGGLVKERLQVYRNVLGASLTFVSKQISDVNGYPFFILYFKLESVSSDVNYDTVYLSNFSVATIGKQLQAYFFVYPRAAFNYVQDFNGLSSLSNLTPGSIKISGSIIGGGVESGTTLKWGTSHKIYIGSNGQSPGLIFIHMQNINAVFMFFMHSINLIYSSTPSHGITITENNDVLDITTPSDAYVSYMLIAHPQ